MHDVAWFESQGLPSTAILSTAFQKQAHYQADGLGLNEVKGLLTYVLHPISDQTVPQMADKADGCMESAVAALLTGDSGSTPTQDGGAPAEDCMA